VMLPLGPVGSMAFGSSLFSLTTRWTAGDRCGSSPFTWAEPVLAAAGAAAGAAVAPEAAMLPICCPGVTVAPVSASIVNTPAAGADTSTATLSVSISTSSSSLATVSPDFFSQVPIEPSATLSPMVWVMIATEPPEAGAATGAATGSAFGALVFGASVFGASAFAAGAALAPSLTTPSTAPGVTVSPSGALISD